MSLLVSSPTTPQRVKVGERCRSSSCGSLSSARASGSPRRASSGLGRLQRLLDLLLLQRLELAQHLPEIAVYVLGEGEVPRAPG